MTMTSMIWTALTLKGKRRHMHIFHNLDCLKLKGGRCTCGMATEFDPPFHFTNIDTLEEVEEGRDLHYGDLTVSLPSVRFDRRPRQQSGLTRDIGPLVKDILCEVRSEMPLRPFVEGEPIGRCQTKGGTK